jgi:glutaredoxin
MRHSLLHAMIVLALITSSPAAAFAQILMRSFPQGMASAPSKPMPEHTLPTLEDDDKKLAKAEKEAQGLPANDEIIVYGRKGCGITQKYIKEFKQAGIAHTYKDIDDQVVDKEFTEKIFAAGMGGSINLPVIENDGKLTQRPSLATFLKDKAPNTTAAKDASPTNQEKPASGDGKLVVYGRMGCSVTKRYVSELQQAGIPYTFCDIDTPAGGNEFNQKLSQAGFSGSIDLPVINDNGKISIRPKLTELLKNAKPQKDANNKADTKKNPITIYSVKSCANTKKYMEELNDLSIPFVFKDVDNPTIHKEFSQKLIAAGYSGSINLPAVIIEGKVFIKPTLTATMQARKQ